MPTTLPPPPGFSNLATALSMYYTMYTYIVDFGQYVNGIHAKISWKMP